MATAVSDIQSTPRVAVIEPRSDHRTFIGRLRRLPNTWVGGALVMLVIAAAVFAPIVAPTDPLEQFTAGLSANGTPLPPNGQFIFGTDHLGRDVWARLIYGARVSLLISFVANMTAAVVGTTIGMLAGYYSGWIDAVLMRFTDVLLAFPAVLLALGLGAVLKPSIPVVILILAIISWPAMARLIRSQVLSVRERQFIESARASGASDGYILLRHVLPNTINVTVVCLTLGIASAVLIEAALGFLGVGVPRPTPSWGNMVAEGQSLYRIAPWIILAPTLAILITTLGFNLLGDAVRDALDPKTTTS
jgi:peptide/nickel transport system permease protein